MSSGSHDCGDRGRSRPPSNDRLPARCGFACLLDLQRFRTLSAPDQRVSKFCHHPGDGPLVLQSVEHERPETEVVPARSMVLCELRPCDGVAKGRRLRSAGATPHGPTRRDRVQLDTHATKSPTSRGPGGLARTGIRIVGRRPASSIGNPRRSDSRCVGRSALGSRYARMAPSDDGDFSGRVVNVWSCQILRDISSG